LAETTKSADARRKSLEVLRLYESFFSVGTVAGAGVGALLLLLKVPIGVHFVGTGECSPSWRRS
jgi:hypothetical protein